MEMVHLDITGDIVIVSCVTLIFIFPFLDKQIHIVRLSQRNNTKTAMLFPFSHDNKSIVRDLAAVLLIGRSAGNSDSDGITNKKVFYTLPEHS